MNKQLSEGKKAIDAVVALDVPYTWDNLVAHLDEVDDKLERIWSPVSHMNSVVNTDELRDAYDSCLAMLSEYGTWVGQHQGLFNAYQQLADSPEYLELSSAQQKVIKNALRDFKLSGIALPENEQQRYGEIQTALSELASKFSNNLTRCYRCIYRKCY